MLRLSFVIPPEEDLNEKPFKQHQLTALYLLSILERRFGEELDLSVIDLRGVVPESIPFYLPERDIYCYTVFCSLFSGVKLAMHHLRRLFPKSIHLAGGPHVNLFPEECSQVFDAICTAEGEVSIVEMVQHIMSHQLEKVYKDKQLVNLDEYPFPRRHFMNLASVADSNFFNGENGQLTAANVLFSRGCPFSCSFCANLSMGPTRYRNASLIEEEIEYLKKECNVEALVLRDDNGIPVGGAAFNKRVTFPFFEAVGRTGVKWRGQSRANGISEETVSLAAQANCTDIAIGLESVSQPVLKIINKKIDLDEARRYIGLLQKHGIAVKLLLILGLPGESDTVVEEVLDFVDETNPKVVQVSLFTPYPGSDMTDNHKKYGIKQVDKNFENFHILYGRFDSTEKPRMFYEFDEVTPWGKGKKAEQILGEYDELQSAIRERDLIF